MNQHSECETPCVVVDSEKMERNIAAMAGKAREAGLHLRPHAKTHKMPWIALKQIAAGAVGITVAKTAEAEIMADHGVKDIFIAYPLIAQSKIDRALALSRRIRLIVGCDSLLGAERLAEAARRAGQTLEIRLEVDTGLRRTGVPYDQAVETAVSIHAMEGLRLTGIFTFRGAMLGGKPTLDLAAAGEEEGRLMAELGERIRAAGVPITDISIGSTPTAAYASKVKGITEIRPGTYVYQDRMQAAFGVCSLEDCAGSVRVTVVSRPTPDLAIIDGGSKTFATDVQPNSAPLHLVGFGHIVEAGLEDAVFERMSEEYGMLRLGPIAQHSGLKIGDVLHIIPNHICSTVNLHDKVNYLRNGRYEPEPVLARGKLE